MTDGVAEGPRPSFSPRDCSLAEYRRWACLVGYRGSGFSGDLLDRRAYLLVTGGLGWRGDGSSCLASIVGTSLPARPMEGSREGSWGEVMGLMDTGLFGDSTGAASSSCLA